MRKGKKDPPVPLAVRMKTWSNRPRFPKTAAWQAAAQRHYETYQRLKEKD